MCMICDITKPDLQCGDFVTHEDHDNGIVIAVSLTTVTVDYQSGDCLVHSFDDLNDIFCLQQRYRQCQVCGYETIMGRKCGFPCV